MRGHGCNEVRHGITVFCFRVPRKKGGFHAQFKLLVGRRRKYSDPGNSKQHRYVKNTLRICKNYDEIFFFEEGSRRGGIGEYLLTELYGKGYRGKYFITASDGACGRAYVYADPLREVYPEYVQSLFKLQAASANVAELTACNFRTDLSVRLQWRNVLTNTV